MNNSYERELPASILNVLPLGVMIVDQDGTVKVNNRMAEELLARNRGELVGQPFADIFSHDASLKRVFETGESVQDVSVEVQGKWLLCSLSLHVTSDGKEAVCLLKNTSELDQVFEQLHKVEMLNLELEMIINSSFDEIFVTDGDGTVLRVNPAGEALYGMKAEEMIGKNTNELSERGLYSPALYPIVKERKERVSMIQRTKTGKTVHVIANPVFNEEGNMTLIIFTSRDLTEIRYLRDKIERTEVLLQTYKSELEELKQFYQPQEDIVAYSPNMRKILRLVHRIAKVDSTVLITGESGVGKGVIAYAIHKNSERGDGPFVHINCGAIPEALIESELFGYEGGAFTGARKEGSKGLIEQANGGSLFLDEIGEMPANLQVKLLKALQERKINRVGSGKSIDIDVRIIAATNRDLEKMVAAGEFREDLYYRLNVIPIHIPPLKARPEDVSYLIDYFIKKFCEKYKLPKQLALEAENALIRYPWPGNVRELENMIERLVVTTEGTLITLQDLPDSLVKKSERAADSIILVQGICPLKQAQEEMEEQLVRKAYQQYKSSYKVAEVLGINQSTAIRKVHKYMKNK
ncbi:sigma 54-interacting transcriptional regulator [Brevibacillus sp. B_LB10_24]|uniref:sigma 54-interacting transcriptional regulator n=1 Tax=Brevibacillus sp. B_LB10_24 TaxID=3380645 RepID=UPI0038BA1BF3